MLRRQREIERREDENRFTATLAGFAAALLLGIIGFWVMDKLARQSKLEDCLLQGRMNCERLELSPVRRVSELKP
jgi:hypothetical protein